jgi:hypothetical protein
MKGGPLASRPFRWVWGGDAVSMVGDASYDVVLAWVALTSTGSPSALAAVVLAAAVPRGVLLLLGGALTDRLSARRVLITTHLIRGTTVGALAVLAATATLQLPHLIIAAVITGAAEAFFWPATSSIVPTLVGKDDLPRANALVGSAEQTAMLVGPLLGGALLSWASPAWALGFNAVTFFIASVTTRAAPRREGNGADSRMTTGQLLASIRSGLAYARHAPALRIALFLVTAATLSYSGLFAVGLPALARGFGRGGIGLGVMVASWGLGQLIGVLSATVTGLPRRWGLLIIAMSAAECLAFLSIGLFPHVAVAVVLLGLLGFGVAYSTDVALPTLVQTTTPADLLGRVNSVINLPRIALAPLSIAGMGLLAAADARLPFLVAAAPMALLAIGLIGSRTARAAGLTEHR